MADIQPLDKLETAAALAAIRAVRSSVPATRELPDEHPLASAQRKLEINLEELNARSVR